MIPDRPLLWQQLDGPIANALKQAKWEYWRNEVEFYETYFKSIKIDVLNELPIGKMLDSIGAIMDFPRPILVGSSEPPGDFVFSGVPPGSGYAAGFDRFLNNDPSTGAPDNWAGRLDGNDLIVREMTDVNYRKMLYVLSRTTSERGSIKFWDEMLREFLHPTQYKFKQGGILADDLYVFIDERVDFDITNGLKALARRYSPPMTIIDLMRLDRDDD